MLFLSASCIATSTMCLPFRTLYFVFVPTSFEVLSTSKYEYDYFPKLVFHPSNMRFIRTSLCVSMSDLYVDSVLKISIFCKIDFRINGVVIVSKLLTQLKKMNHSKTFGGNFVDTLALKNQNFSNVCMRSIWYTPSSICSLSKRK